MMNDVAQSKMVFSAHAEVVPVMRPGLSGENGILRARGGSSTYPVRSSRF